MNSIAKGVPCSVIARNGPYSNAETNAGGLALWTSDGSGGEYSTPNIPTNLRIEQPQATIEHPIRSIRTLGLPGSRH